MQARDVWPLLPGEDRPRRHCGERVGWRTWTLCGTLTGLVVGASLWRGPDAVRDVPPIVAAPAVAAGVSIQPATVWVALSTRVYYRPEQPGFGTAFPGVFMTRMQAVARGCWPASDR